LKEINEGGFGVLFQARLRQWGRVVYKELKSSVIKEGSKFVYRRYVTSCLLVNESITACTEYSFIVTT